MMVRKLCLTLISIFLTVAANPMFLTAADEAQVVGLDTSNIVETIPLPEPIVETPVSQPPYDVVSYAAAPAVTTAPAPVGAVMPYNAISVAGRVLPIVDVADTVVDAGDHVNKYGTKFLYGHNSPAVFGGLVNLGVGNVFMVSYGGVTTTYQVGEVQVFEKTSDTTLGSNGVNYRMSAIVNGKGRYDMVLMTCYGTIYGNGDASHRLVVFANRV